MDICSLSLGQLEGLLQKKDISAREATEACLRQINKTEPFVEALITIDEEGALRRAEELDRQGPTPTQALWGVPLVLKDAISTKGLRTTSASRILENFVPIYDAFVVRRLREAGAIILAKANLDEFAMGSSTENSAFKKTRNPWDLRRVPGGSSGGSAASVAALQCFGSLGSDTGGSIRQPAAFCGCVGLKPTYGRVSRFGLFAFASSMDQIGPIARNVEDCARILSVIAGHDSRDNTSAPAPAEDYLAAMHTGQDKELAGVKIGYCSKFFGEGLSAEVRTACIGAMERARALGAELVEASLPDPDIATATYYVLSMAEASSNLARYDGVRYGRRAAGVATLDELYLKSRSQGFGAEVKRRVMLGSFVLSTGYYDAYFQKAAQVRRLIHDQYSAALEDCDLLFMPVAPVTAWELGAHEASPLQAYLMDAYTLPVNLAGLPAISLPAGLGQDSGMPVGIQLVGKRFGETSLLRYALCLEQTLPRLGFPPEISISD